MAAPVMPAADTVTRALLAARDADWRAWTCDDFRRIAGQLGWPVTGDAADTGIPGLTCLWRGGMGGLCFETLAPPVPAAPAPGVPAPAAPDPVGYAGQGWGMPGAWPRDQAREVDAAHTRLVAAITATAGPASWRGGPGAWLRWRTRRTTLLVARDHDPAALRMEVIPTLPREQAEQEAFERATGLGALPYDWCVSRPDLSLGELFLPVGPQPRDWADFAGHLPRMLGTLVTELPLIGWVEPVLIVVADVEDSRHTVELRVGQDRLEVGGLAGGARQMWLRPGMSHAAGAASLLLEAFAGWDVQDAARLRVRAWTSGGYIDFPGLGIAPEVM